MKTLNLIFQFILFVAGTTIIASVINWWLVLGIFLVIWANNIQMSDNYKEYFNKKLEDK